MRRPIFSVGKPLETLIPVGFSNLAVAAESLHMPAESTVWRVDINNAESAPRAFEAAHFAALPHCFAPPLLLNGFWLFAPYG